jgi:nitronate monooxygenase
MLLVRNERIQAIFYIAETPYSKLSTYSIFIPTIMNWKNELTTTLNIQYPIVQGPFGGGLSSVHLAATVSSNGGMGSFGAHHLSFDEIIEINNQLRKATKHTYAINLWIDNDKYNKEYTDADYERTKSLFKPYFDELNIALPPKPIIPKEHSNTKQLEAILEARPPVFSFVYGIPPQEVIRELKKAGTKIIGVATNVEEAVEIEDAGVDVVVASGFEAGGHRVSFQEEDESKLMGGVALIPRVVDAVNIPVVAAGGLADARGIVAALALGAQGAQIGTAFLACEESNASALHKEVLHSAISENTLLTKSFTGRLARGTISKIALETKHKEAFIAPYPFQSLFIRPLRQAMIEQKNHDLVTFWSGQSAPLIKHHQAEKLLKSLIVESEQLIQQLHR